MGDAAEVTIGSGAGSCRALVEHCVARYGAAHVRGWLWELWNEPDISYWRGTPSSSTRSTTSRRPR